MKNKKHYYIYSNLIPDGLIEQVDKDKWLDKHLKTLERTQDKPYLQNTEKSVNDDYFSPPHLEE